MKAPDIKTPLPGPKARAIIERDARFVSPSYTRDYPFVIARGEGAVVEDVDGNRFLDCAAGIAVNSTGVSHPDVVRAITEQAQKFIHMSGTDFYYEPQVRLAEELASIAPIDGEVRTFFANSGTETTEAAIKLSRYFTKRQGIIAFFGGVPRPLARRAVADRQQGDPAPRVRSAACRASITRRIRTPYRFTGSADACAAASLSFIKDQLLVHLAAPDEIAAIVVEPIQGEGGYVVPPPAFLQGLRELTSQHGMLLVVDEVQSGMGRTGKMFACEHFGLQGRHRQHRQGHRVGAAARRHLRARRRDVVAAGRACQHVRRQPGRRAPRRMRRSSCSRAGWSPTRPAVGAHLHRRLARAAGEAPADRRRPRQGPDDRHRAGPRSPDQGARRRGAQRARPGDVPPRRAGPRRRQERAPPRAAAGPVDGAGRPGAADLRRGARRDP